jgi:hypothetical protein
LRKRTGIKSHVIVVHDSRTVGPPYSTAVQPLVEKVAQKPLWRVEEGAGELMVGLLVREPPEAGIV